MHGEGWHVEGVHRGAQCGDPVTGVHRNASGTARGVEGQHGLDGHVHGWRVEGLEYDLGLLTVGLGVRGASVSRTGYSMAAICS